MTEIDGLDVYMHGEIAGLLERRSRARLRFTYDESWVAEDRRPLSLSLPVRSQPYDHEECAPFFEGLLPEGDFLKAIARTLHVSATNPFQLLTELGGECAGAISVAPVGGTAPGRDPRPPRWLTDEELGSLLADLPQRPLIAAIDEVEDGGGFRLSLAGAQNKVGVLVKGSEVGLSHGRPPTTAILKAPISYVSESVVNEAFCMRLAAHIDLDVAESTPRIAASEEYLLVYRYDRGKETFDGRVHQEDFCQALGLVPAVKYEKEGGPTVANCAELIRRHFSAPARDIQGFLDALLFDFAIANHDAHSKNYSLLLDGPGSIRLAPLYDLISTAVFHGSDRKLAMRYGGENRPAYLRGRHLDRLARDLDVKPALVRRRAVAMHERTAAAVEDARRALPEEFQDRPILDKVVAVVSERGEMLARRATEAGETGRAPSIERARDGLDETEDAARVISEGLESLADDLKVATEITESAADDLSALAGRSADSDFAKRAQQLATELEGSAEKVMERGRRVYDAVVELDSGAERVLKAIDGVEGFESTDAEFVTVMASMAEAIDANINGLERVYSAIRRIGEISPLLRSPVRNIRAGLHDVLDARAIVSEWRVRASSVGSGNGTTG